MMKVKELIELLSKYDPAMDVIISDGYRYNFYSGEYTINEFEGTVDIGVGDCYMEDE